MANDLTIFNYQQNQVRTVVVNGEPWFVSKDVCSILELSNIPMAIQALEPEEKGVNQIDTLGGRQSVSIISEPGLYRLLMRSDKPQAKPFQKWVVSDVLPSIRKTGQYGALALPQNYEEALEHLLVKVRENKALTQKITEDAPKVAFADDFQGAIGNILVREMAKSLKTGEKRLYQWLRDQKLIMKNNEPYVQYVDAGYFETKSGYHDQGDKKVTHRTLTITPAGVYWLSKRWNFTKGVQNV